MCDKWQTSTDLALVSETCMPGSSLFELWICLPSLVRKFTTVHKIQTSSHEYIELLVPRSVGVSFRTKYFYAHIQSCPPVSKVEWSLAFMYVRRYRHIYWRLPHNQPIPVRLVDSFHRRNANDFSETVGWLVPNSTYFRERRQHILIHVVWTYHNKRVRLI